MKILSRVFRGKFLAGLKRLHRSKKLYCAGPAVALADSTQFAKLIRRLHRHDWVVYAKPAFGGPLQVLRYPSSSRLGTKLPFKSQNSTRPPQTPAASS